ncbi:unnamed protein product, partial [Medioppia subpectinata]
LISVKLSTLIGYLGNRYSRPRMIAISEMILVLSSVISASPYFIYGPGTHLLYDDTLMSKMTANNTRYELCTTKIDTQDCTATGGHSTVWPAVIILVIGSALRGVGYTAYCVFGLAFIDDSVSKKSSPLYMSLWAILRMIGPAGVDPHVSSTDPRFIGAWWIGFLVIAGLLFLATLPMFLFPRQLKGASVKEKDRVEYDKSSQGYFQCVKRLITNPLFMFNLIGNCFRFNGHQGYGVTKPKYIESQYRVSGSKANLLTGVTGMLPVAIGGCECTTSVFTPMCSADEVTTYFSPCYAGCVHLDQNTGIATNCSCIADHGGLATTAYIPYPLIYGAIADSVCLVWESTCGKTGNCWLYNQNRFRYVLHIVTLHNKNDDQDDHIVTTCGLGSWRPGWLQVFATPFWFAIVYALIGVVQTMSTTGKEVCDGWLQVFATPFWFAIVYALIGVVQTMSTTYLIAVLTSVEKRFAFDSKISGVILIADNIVELFLSPLIGYLGNRYSRPRMIAVSEMILVLSCAINAMPYFIYGPGTHLLYDDTLLSKMTANNTRYELCSAKIDTIDCTAKGVNPNVKSTDPRFIGAWWLGFLVIGVLLFLVNLPMFLFPKQLKGASVKEIDRVEYANSHGFMDCTKRLLTNPLFMFNLIGNALRYTGYGGYGTTKPKYMESQYRVSGSKANLLTGVANLLPMAAGTLAGGIGIRYIKPKALYLIIYMFCLEWVSNLTMLASMFLGCPPLQLGPIGDTKTTTFTMSAACNQGCDCTTSVFTPMCSADTVTTFFSPCYAGCTNFDKVTGIATNCKCISDHGGLATSGYCQSDADNCTNLYNFLMVKTLPAIVTSTVRTGNILLALRVIDPKDKSFAMAYIPYPIIFGSIADSVCLVWESTCGKSGNCWLYDQDRFRYVLHGATLALIIVASLCDVQATEHIDKCTFVKLCCLHKNEHELDDMLNIHNHMVLSELPLI